MNDAYKINRNDIFLGRKLEYGETGSNSFVRLAKRNAGKWKRPVHEVWDVNGTIGNLKTPLDHHAADSVSDFVIKLNYYTTINAQYLYDNKVKVTFLDIILYPKAKFFQNYILKQGFRDGIYGFVHAVFMSLHSFLTRGKLYLLWHNKPII